MAFRIHGPIFVLFTIAACSSEAPKTAGGGTAAQASGVITYAEPVDTVFAFDLATKDNKKLVDSASEPDRFPSGELLYVDTLAIGQPGKIARANADGSNPTTLFEPGSTVTWLNPVASPDGTKIAINYYPRGFAHKLAPEDGTVVTKTNGTVVANLAGVFDPAWLPDGRLVLAGSVDDPSGDAQANPTATPKEAGLFVSSADLKTVTKIAATTTAPQMPAVSPDGTRIAFMDQDHIWIVGIDGADLRQLTAGTHKDSSPCFSPDGASIAFQSYGSYATTQPYAALAIISASLTAPIEIVDGTSALVIDPGQETTSSKGRVNAFRHMHWR